VATFLLFALYGPASAAFVYMISFFFKSHSMAQNIVLLLNLLAVIALLVVDIMVFIPRCVPPCVARCQGGSLCLWCVRSRVFWRGASPVHRPPACNTLATSCAGSVALCLALRWVRAF